MNPILIQDYLNEIDRLKKFSGSTTEGVISDAFKDLLKAWARRENLVFVPQYEFLSPQRNRIRPDGTILHDLRVPLGYWEAKDTADDLDEEIRKKLAKGYPQDNIIFENSATAVLIQNRQEVLRCDMRDVERLGKLVALFFRYERQEIADFRKAVAQFSQDLPAVLGALREKIDAAYGANAAFIQAAAKFLALARQTINPSVSEADVREMLIQHILTEEIFAHVFNDGDFHRENNIAKELYALEAKFFTGAVKRDTLKALEPYYAAIRANAAQISSHSEKQAFLKLIYERFYKVYNPKAADRLGVVYTPNEIVKFMIEGADWLCQKHFKKTLIDRDVEILDPATGTGTFICELLEHFRGQPEKLTHKYKEELHANEVAILPYYVANLNIEATYAAITGQFAEYPNLCFVDTLDNVTALGVKTGQHVGDLFGALSDENVERIRRQNRRKISVIIGNPPYNANQQNENDNNKNRAYPDIDRRIKDSYIKASTAQKTKLYDMYARFYRWASDRLHDDGVLAFVTNRSFIDSRTFDGFRKVVAQEFAEIFVVDLGGDIRANPKLSGTKHNVFGIQTGVAITFLVKKRKKDDCRIFYARRPEFATAEEKLAFLANSRFENIKFAQIKPDQNFNWLGVVDNDWESLLPIAAKLTKTAKTQSKERAVFKLFSLGVVTARDDWVYDCSVASLKNKIAHICAIYKNDLQNSLNETSIGFKWTRHVKALLKQKKAIAFDPKKTTEANYRPFVKRYLYRDESLNEVGYQTPQIFGFGERRTSCITTMGDSSGKPYFSFAIDIIPDLNFVSPASGGTVTYPRYRYTPEGERIDNITDWALKQFRAHYAQAAALPPLHGERSGEAAGWGAPGAGVAALPSPLAGEGGSARSAETDEGLSSAAAAPSSGSIARSPERASSDALGDHLLPPQGVGADARLSTGYGEKGRPRKTRPADQITKDDIFHYVYGVLHDPVYREKYALNLKREFPRIPFYPDFRQWAAWGERLMALHIGYETVEPWPLQRHDIPDEKARAAGVAPKCVLKSDGAGAIRIDSETSLSGIPPAAFAYRLGNRSGLDWICDQYKEKKPKDPTIREKFNTYRFADYKEKVIDLIARVTRVSVETMEIVEAMKSAAR
jgi:predicted helicase